MSCSLLLAPMRNKIFVDISLMGVLLCFERSVHCSLVNSPLDETILRSIIFPQAKLSNGFLLMSFSLGLGR